jgi:serine protease AprX
MIANARRLVAALVLTLATGVLAPLAPNTPLSSGVEGVSAASTRITPDLQRLLTADPLKLWPIIVEMRAPVPPFGAGANETRARQALALLTRYGRPVGGLALINGAAGAANAAGVTAISLDPQVAFIYADASLAASSSTASTEGLSSAYPTAVHADQVWQRGVTGRGGAVAVLDSGINPDGDLTSPSNRLVAAANYAGPRGAVADGGGHGTHVAGSIAGNGHESGGAYIGIAPDANVVDVRVLDTAGRGRTSSVIRGIEWVLAHRHVYGIKVINLSLGRSQLTPYQLDPLCAAVEMAWMRGVAVVVAAGNGGPQGGTVQSPAIDPYVMSVGATDDRGTAGVGDDVLATFSAWGTPPLSSPRPDFVAPGRRIVSVRVPGSTLDRLYPDRVTVAPNGATYFRLSGTSSATAVVSGAAMLVLQQQPGLGPEQLKSILSTTAQTYGGAAVAGPADGSGLIDAFAATFGAQQPRGGRSHRPADSFARAVYPVVYGAPLVWKNPSFMGRDFRLLSWATLPWDAITWDNLAWDNLAWDNLAWDNLAWDNLAWDNLAWDNLAWDAEAASTPTPD